ncbi:MAG: protein translocase subunit SecD [Planctomycetia bacterium]|nr:protein translocase subunit SecD [Planctomycetia bacterium]
MTDSRLQRLFLGMVFATAAILFSTDNMLNARAQEAAPEPVAADVANVPASEQGSAEPDTAAAPAPEAADAATEEASNAKPAESAPADEANNAPADDAVASSVAPASPLRTQEEATGNGFGLIIFGAVVLIFVGAFLISRLLSSMWRMPEYQNGYFIISFCFLGALASTVFGLVGNRMNLGIDLRGGSILVYSVSPNIADNATPEEIQRLSGKTITNEEMNELKAAIGRRINPNGVREISIQELGNNSEVKITIPEADEAEVARLERIINSTGQLKFRILASTGSPEEKPLLDRAQSPEMKDVWEIRLPEPIGRDNIIKGGSWVPVDPTQMDSITAPDLLIRDSLLKDDSNPAAPKFDVFVLELIDLYDVYGRHMATIRESVGQRGDPEVLFSMNSEGAERLQHLTNRYKAGADRPTGRQMGIVMNDFLYSAPRINDTIARSGVITFGNDLSAGSRTRIQGEVRDLIQVMNAGVLPAKLSEIPVTKMVTGPTLGADTIEKGKNSIIWGGALVLVFMVMYYGFGGLVASFAVILNLLLIMTFMLGLRAAFTLPGLAGLILTVGMAVDANVLIFERIKEELGAGATLKMAIRNGFSRAFSAIVDSNVTTMITAVILYAVGTDQIKGFAITLFLGVGFSMFTATFVSRVIFETCEKLGLIGKKCVYPILPVLKPIGKTNIDFMAYRKVAMTIFVAAIVVGMVAVVARGKGIFDIDFVGGVEVQAIFKEKQNIADVRAKLKALPDLSVSNLSLSKDRSGNPVAPDTCFTICTSCPPDMVADEYRTTVEEKLKEAFGDSLRHYVFTSTLRGTEEVPVAGTAGDKEQKIVYDITVQPSLSREVVLGFFQDNPEIKAKMADDAAYAIDVTNQEYLAGDKEAAAQAWQVYFPADDQALADRVAKAVTDQVNGTQVFESSNTIGSSVASQARVQGMLAILGSLLCIILYIWIRFTKVVFGLSSVIALVYNVLITLGFIGLSVWVAPFLGSLGISEFKIGLATVAAFLTIIGYSLNDTIVLFDRIREVKGKGMAITPELINTSINQTLSRTILTSVTTLFVAAVLYFFGGAGIHTFAFAMCSGIIVGTFATIFVAAPWLYWLSNWEAKKASK